MRIAENLLNTMISTGEERANYDEYLFRMGSVMEAGHKAALERDAEVCIDDSVFHCGLLLLF